MKVCAYDYELQRWLTGEEARQLRIMQLREELACLEGPRGKEYAAFVKLGQIEAVTACRKAIRELGGAL